MEEKEIQEIKNRIKEVVTQEEESEDSDDTD